MQWIGIVETTKTDQWKDEQWEYQRQLKKEREDIYPKSFFSPLFVLHVLRRSYHFRHSRCRFLALHSISPSSLAGSISKVCTCIPTKDLPQGEILIVWLFFFCD